MEQLQEHVIIESAANDLQYKFQHFQYNMQSILNELEQQKAPAFKEYNSAYYQPARILISSDQSLNTFIAGNNVQEDFFADFTVKLPRAALEVKSIQLVRASIPNAIPCIPDTSTIFWYYRIPIGTLPAAVFNPAYLFMVRLLPSWYKPELNPQSQYYGFNRTFISYQDLAIELIKSCAADPIYTAGLYPGQFFIPDDISITYNQTTNKFSFIGNDAAHYYVSAGYLDPNIAAAQPQLQAASKESDGFGLSDLPQQYQLHQTLNLRLGFTWDGSNLNLNAGNSAVNQTLAERFRPTFPTTAAASIVTNVYSADNYANLVYSNCCQLYMDIVAGGTVDTAQNTNFLASVPMNASNLGITFYNPVISNPLTKIQNHIYQMTISMFTDTNSPFYISNNAIISLEFALTY